MPDALIRRKARFARHNSGFQAGLLLVDTIFDKRALFAVNDKFRVVDFDVVAGFDDGFQIAIKQLRLEGIVRVRFVAQAADVIADVIGAAKQRDNLIHRMHAEPEKHAVFRQSRFGFRFRPVVVEMAFNFDNLAQLAALNHFTRGQKTRIKAAVLIRRDHKPFAFCQIQQQTRIRDACREWFLHQHVFPGFQRTLRIVKVAVGMRADHHQFYRVVVQDVIQIARKVNVLITRVAFQLRFRVTAEDMRDVKRRFAV